MKPLNILLLIFGLPVLAVAVALFLTVGTLFTLFRLFTLLCLFTYTPMWIVLEKWFPSDLRRRHWPDAVKTTMAEIAEDWRYLYDKFTL